MSIKQQLEANIKQAMLAGDKNLVTVLRGLKSAILYAEVASGKREVGIDDQEVLGLLQKEAKKRQESADLYGQGGSIDKQNAELAEKKIIEQYLPKKLSEEEIGQLVKAAIADTGASNMQQMGQVIGYVKQASNGAADGATVARLVKERLA